MKSTEGIIYFLLIALAAFSDFSLGQQDNENCNDIRDTKRHMCAPPHAEYVPALRLCTWLSWRGRFWDTSRSLCKTHRGVLPYVNRIMQDFLWGTFRREKRDYWIGLNDFDGDGQFEWQGDGEKFNESDYNRFNKAGDLNLSANAGKCVAASPANNHSWHFEKCHSVKKLYICIWPWEFLPLERPGLTQLANNVSINKTKLQQGSKLTFRCNANLNYLGYMRYFIFSDDYQEYITTSDIRVYYYEVYTSRQHPTRPSKLCSRSAVAEINLTVTADLDGKRVACVTFTEDTIRQCSTEDLFCNASSVLSVNIDSSLGQEDNADCNNIIDTKRHTCAYPYADYMVALKRCVWWSLWQQNWDEANITCNNNIEGELVYVDRIVQDFLPGYLRGKIHDYWIGLNDLDGDGQFEWASDGEKFNQSDFNRFNETEDLDLRAHAGKCVAASTANNHSWFFEDCSIEKFYVCSWPSALMPKSPGLIRAADNVNITETKLQEGTNLTFRCNATLNYLGSMRYFIFSDDYEEYITTSDVRILYYDEEYQKREALTRPLGICSRSVVAEINLNVTADLDGKRVACVTFTEDTIRQCSTEDLFCNASSVLSVNIVTPPPRPPRPTRPGPMDTFDQRMMVIAALIGTAASWLVTLLLLNRTFFKESLDRMKTRPNDVYAAPKDKWSDQDSAETE